jgi:hypothetical protein
VARKQVIRICLAALAGALALLAGGTAASAAPVALSCSGQTYVQPFQPWLDPASYVLMAGGALETTTGWTLSGGAKLVSGNEPFRVNNPRDSNSLLLPSGGSATSPTLCITLLHPTLRFFARNSGSPISALKVEAVMELLGTKLVTPVGLLLADGNWRPTLPLPFLVNLISPVTGSVAFRFTPVGIGNSGWQIDDVYVDPYKQG